MKFGCLSRLLHSKCEVVFNKHIHSCGQSLCWKCFPEARPTEGPFKKTVHKLGNFPVLLCFLIVPQRRWRAHYFCEYSQKYLFGFTVHSRIKDSFVGFLFWFFFVGVFFVWGWLFFFNASVFWCLEVSTNVGVYL